MLKKILLISIAASLSLSLLAQRSVGSGNRELESLSVAFPEGYIPSGSVPLENMTEGAIVNKAAFDAFKERYGACWSIFINRNNGKPSYIGGSGIPMIPGRGNSLRAADLFGDQEGKPSVDYVDCLVRKFLAENYDLFGLKDGDLSLMDGSGFYGDRNYLCFLNYQISHGGVPIEGAVFQARLNHGNLVDMGIIGEYEVPAFEPIPMIGSGQVREIVSKHIKGFTAEDEILENPTLKYIPVYLGQDKPFGRRIGHRLVWEMSFVRKNVSGQWDGTVDARSGELFKFADVAQYDTYKRIHALVKMDRDGQNTPVDRPLGFVRVDSNGSSSTINGLYPYPGGTASCSLNSSAHPDGETYAWIDEYCETKPDLESATGDLDWGGSSDRGCAYTGVEHGDATSSALNLLYHVTKKKQMMLSYLPGNDWLDNAVQIKSNLDECGPANWGGGTINFPACNNTTYSALEPGTIAHETGHGLDSNDGLIIAGDGGTDEMVADTSDLTYNRDSWWHGDDPLNMTPQNRICTECSPGPSYPDPCGYQGHCTSFAITQGMWDLAARDLTAISGMSQATAWERFSRLFYLSRAIAGHAYECTTATQCEDWVSSGCQAGNWYRAFRVVDDDNGNLCDGTPNGAAIYNAFNTHNIACPPISGCPNENTNYTICPSLGAPAINSITGQACKISLAWIAVPGAVEYKIFRNEAGPDKEYMILATVTEAVTDYIDTGLYPGLTYYYEVQAVGSNPSCTGPMSNTQSAAASDCSSCVIPAPPGSASCSAGSSQIDVSWSGDGTGDGYRVYRRKDGEYNWTLVSEQVGSVTTFTDTKFICGEDYQYKIASLETTGGFCESYSSTLTGTCSVPCCTPPSAPTMQNAADTCTELRLLWTPGSGLTQSYNLYRKTGTGCSGTFTRIAGPLTATSYTDAAALPGIDYTYYVRGACDPNGLSESPNSGCVTERTLAPQNVEHDIQVTADCDSIDLSWPASNNALDYRIMRTTNPDCQTGIAEQTITSSTSWSDTSVMAGNTYYYRVIARNTDCGEAQSDVCVYSALIAPPEAPTFDNIGCTSLTVSWKGAINADTYDLYRKEGSCGIGALIASDLTGTSYDDTGLSANQEYNYYVFAKNSCPYSASSICSSVTTLDFLAAPEAPTFPLSNCNTVSISWTPVSGATSYDVYQNIGGCGAGVKIASDLEVTTYDQDGLAPFNVYGFYAVARNQCGTTAGECSTWTSGPGSPSAPSFTNIGGVSLRVQWTPADKAYSYDLYRKSGTCGTGVLIASDITDLYYDDSGLSCAATYSYYLVAENACGSSDPGSCATVSTLNSVPAAPGAPTFSGISCTRALISWDPVPDATTYDLRRKTGACDSAGLIAENLTATSYQDNELQEGMPYSYYVVARNACGYSSNGACNTLTTSQLPEAPSNPHATPQCNKITVLWTGSPGVIEYEVYRTTNSDCVTGLELKMTIESEGWNDSTVLPDTTYYYRIKAKNGCGSSDYSSCVSGRRLDTPAQVTGLFTTPVCPGVSLAWTDIADVTFTVYRTDNPDCATGLAAIGTTDNNTYDDTTAAPGTTYYYKVSAKNTCGEGPKSDCASGTLLLAPDAPSAPTYTDVQCQRLTVNWTAPARATLYDVYRRVGECGTGTLLAGNQTGTSYTDTFLENNTKYSYYVSAKNSCGSSDPGPCSSITTLDLPADPSGLSQVAGCPTITLGWTGSAGAAEYYVWRTLNPDCVTNLGLVGTPTGTIFSDATANPGVTYYYKIQAHNVCGTSTGFSNCIPAIKGTAPSPPSNVTGTPTCSTVEVSWTPPAGEVTLYEIYRSTISDCTTGLTLLGTSLSPAFSDTNVAAGSFYYYRVKAVNGCGTSNISACSASVELQDTPSPPGPPTFTAVGCDYITLAWNAVAGSTSYDVYRRYDECGTGTLLAGGLSGTSYTDSDLTEGTVYAYYVTSKNACGDSAPGACRTNVPGPPSVPSGLTATGNCADISLHWSDTAGAVSYQIWRTANANCVDDLTMIGTAAGMPDYIDNTAALGVTYYYVVKAVNNCATSGGSSCVSGARMTAPVKPAAFNAAGTCAGATLTWSVVPDTDQYILYRGDICGTAVDTFADVTSPYSDTSALEGVTYIYWVQAVNFCGTGPISDCAPAQRLTSPVPVITGPSMNTCPGLTVLLTTETGQSGYQWYKGGLPISGANSWSYEVSETDSYTVSYTGSNGCPGTSAAHGVIIYVCGPPNIVYQSYNELLEVNGDGDLVPEAGEKWRITVTVTNTGERNAVSVLGSLVGTDALVCTSPGSFGNVPAGGTGSCTFEFIPDPSSWYGTNSCGSMMRLDLVSKSSDGGAYSYADDIGFTSVAVGSPGTSVWEYASQVDALDAQDGTDISMLSPALVGPGEDAVSATASWMLYGDTDLTACVAIRLRAPNGTSEQVLKAAGQADPSSANVLAFYHAQGPGVYSMVLEELAGCGTGAAHIVAGQLSLETDPGCSVGGAVCWVIAPEVSDDASHALTAARNGANVDLLFEDVGAAHYQIYVSTSAQSLPFKDTSPDGRKDCALAGWVPAAGGMLSISNYDLKGTIPGDPGALYFLITADNGSGSEGSLGMKTGGTPRTAQEYCNR